MSQKLYEICSEICLMVYLNVLWIIFVLMGGIVLGIFPATVALFAIHRQRLKGGIETNYRKLFLNYFRTNFVQANVAAVVFILTGFLLYVEYRIYPQLDISGGAVLFQIFSKVSIVLYVITLILFFPVFVHFNVNRTKMFLQPFLMMFMNPIQILGVIMIIIICSSLYYVFPGVMILFFLSLPSGMIMQVMYKRFLKLATLYK